MSNKQVRFMAVCLAAAIFFMFLGLSEKVSAATIREPQVVEVKLPFRFDMNNKFFDKLITLVEKLDARDKMTIRVLGEGGNIIPGIKLMNAISKSPADIRFIVEGPAYSMHATVLCAVPKEKVTMNVGSVLMFHDMQIQAKGSRTQIMKEMEALTKVMKQIANVCVKNRILTRPQADVILNGNELYIPAEEF